MGKVAGAVLLIATLASPDRAEHRAAVRAPALVTFEISAAHNYDFVGPYPFFADFYQMSSFTAPTGRPANVTGSFVFLPKSATSPGGKMQIHFPSVFALFHVRCEVGLPNQAFVIDVSAPNDPYRLQSQSTAAPRNTVEFDTRPMVQPGELTLMLQSPTTDREWNLYACYVTATPQLPPTPKPAGG